MSNKTVSPVVALAVAACAFFTTPEFQAAVVIDTVYVGNPGNAADPTTALGSVSYGYSLGKYEVTIGQYTEFLNSVAKVDTYSLFSTDMSSNLNIAGISRSGSSGNFTYSAMTNSGSSANRPVTFVSWFSAARFANWMANGQPVGAQGNSTTEIGAYTLNGAMSGLNYSKNAVNPNTGAAPTWWIPSVNEWYKAAYYEPGASSDNYWLYPTRSDVVPGNVVGATENQANYPTAVYSVTQNSTYSSSLNYLSSGGAFTSSESYFGTFDQGGNVWEWTDGTLSVPQPTREIRGGAWDFTTEYELRSNNVAAGKTPESGTELIGFRLASIPEPSTAAFLAIALLGLVFYCRRTGRRPSSTC